MDSEARAAIALIIYGTVVSLALILSTLGASGRAVGLLVGLGLLTTFAWSIAPTLSRVLRERRH